MSGLRQKQHSPVHIFCPIRHHRGQRLRQSANGGWGAACGQSVTSRIWNHLSVSRSGAILQEAEPDWMDRRVWCSPAGRPGCVQDPHRPSGSINTSAKLKKLNLQIFFCVCVRFGTQHVSPVTSSEQTWVQVLLTCVYKNFNGDVYGSPLVPRRENLVNDINKEYCK